MARYNFDPYTGKPLNQGGNSGNQGGGNFNRGNYGNNNFGGNSKPPKHSGCKSGMTRTQKPYVRGWKYDKTNGLRSFIAGPNKKTHEVKSLSGKIWQNWTVKVTAPAGIVLYNCLFMVAENKVVIKDLGIVMNPKTNYVGPFYRRKGK